MSGRHESSVTLLKTCQTCFHAKIRCDKTQDSGICDRCLRLRKTCIFAPARRRNAGRTGRLEKRDAPSLRKSPTSSGTHDRGTASSTEHSGRPNHSVYRPELNVEASFDPFSDGILTFERGQELLNLFRTRMMPYFPFVVVSDTVTIQQLAKDKPSLSLAVLSAASHGEMSLQKQLARLFNKMIAHRMVAGTFAEIELLQALLVHVAWAHYSRRPKRFSQHLLLAISIISDLKLDRPRKHNLWIVGSDKNVADPDWSPEEQRAFAGTYYLSSSSSVLLQKARRFNYTPEILESCQRLSAQAEDPTDKYLPYIIHLQKLIEDVDEVMANSSGTRSIQETTAELSAIRENYGLIKSSLPFSLSESPTILLQLSVLDLLISQSSPDGTPFGLNRFQNVGKDTEDRSRLLDWLSQSISAAKSLISIVLILPHGEEGVLPNLGWIMMYCGLSLAVRLDLVAAQASISQTTQHLRRILDMPHTLRQIVLRLEAATSQEEDVDGDEGPFYRFVKRVRHIEEWYLEHSKQLDLSEQQTLHAATDSLTINPQPSTGSTPLSFLDSNSVPSVTVTGDGDNIWAPGFMTDLGSEFDLSSTLFSEPFEFFTDGQY